MLWSLLKIGLFFALFIVFTMMTPVVFKIFDRLKIKSALPQMVWYMFLVVCMVLYVSLMRVEFGRLIDKANEIYIENTSPDMPVLDGLYDNPQVEKESYMNSKYGGR